MEMKQLFEMPRNRSGARRALMAGALGFFAAGVFLLVYVTGGIKYVYSHSMYIPVLLSGFIFGTKGGIVFGIAGGVVLGPFMPVDVAAGEMQDAANWLYRAGFFVLIGALGGAASDGAKRYIRRLEWISRHEVSTGLPNRNALLDALGEISKAPGLFILAVICVQNAAELKSAFGAQHNSFHR